MTRRTLPLSPAGLMAWPAGRVHVFSACRVRNRRMFFCKLEKCWNLSFFKFGVFSFCEGSTTRQRRAQKKKVVGGRSRGVVRGGAGHPPSEFGQRHLRPIGSVTNEGGKEPMGGARSWNLQRFSPAPPSLSIPEKKKISLSPSLSSSSSSSCAAQTAKRTFQFQLGSWRAMATEGSFSHSPHSFFRWQKTISNQNHVLYFTVILVARNSLQNQKKQPENQNISIVIGIFPTLPFLTVKFVRKKQWQVLFDVTRNQNWRTGLVRVERR